jgi:hypothetical protein
MLECVTNLQQRLFLDAYAQLGNIPAAAQLAKVSRQSHYSWLDEPEYAAAFAEVQKEAEDMLFEEAQRRAVDGVERPIFYRGKGLYETKREPKTGEMRPTNKPVTMRQYGDTLLLCLLKALRPEKYRARPQRADLSRLSYEDRILLDQLSRKAHGLPPTQ